MATRSLRAVSDGERKPSPRRQPRKAAPKSVTRAAASGSTRDVLVAMRARIAKAVENPNTPARDLAALTKRLVEVMRDIEAIDAAVEEARAEDGDVIDDTFCPEAI